MSRYLEIRATQEPFSYGSDENSRPMFVFNVAATAVYPVDKFEEEIYKILYDSTLVSGLGTDVFIGPASIFPLAGSGPYTHITRTAGMEPLETHNGDKYERLSCQLCVRAQSYVVARNKIIAIWRALDGQRNITVTAA